MSHRNPVLQPKRPDDIARAHPEEAYFLGEAAFITLVIVAAQSFIIWQFVDSLTLKGDTIHAASDLFVNIGAFVVALLASRGHPHHQNLRTWFTYAGVALLFLGALWVAQEARVRLESPVPLLNGWLIATGIIGGLGNFWVHRIISRIPDEHHTHMHAALDAHVLSDMVLSIIVVMSGLLGYLLGWTRVDPLLSFLAALWMVAMAVVILIGMRACKKEHEEHGH